MKRLLYTKSSRSILTSKSRGLGRGLQDLVKQNDVDTSVLNKLIPKGNEDSGDTFIKKLMSLAEKCIGDALKDYKYYDTFARVRGITDLVSGVEAGIDMLTYLIDEGKLNDDPEFVKWLKSNDSVIKSVFEEVAQDSFEWGQPYPIP